jgi:hypothetical protein
MAPGKRPRTIGDVLANPRNARERAAVAKMNAMAEGFAKQIAKLDAAVKAIKPPTRLDYDTPADRFLEHVNELISRIEPVRKPPRPLGRGRVKGDETAFVAVRDLLGRRKDLSDYSACKIVADDRGLNARNFYKRWQRNGKRT